jgi:hypothetical protein
MNVLSYNMGHRGVCAETVLVPKAVFLGPCGSIIATYLHRQVLAWFIYILDTLALVSPNLYPYLQHY